MSTIFILRRFATDQLEFLHHLVLLLSNRLASHHLVLLLSNRLVSHRLVLQEKQHQTVLLLQHQTEETWRNGMLLL
jgi:hypothetical protein